MNTRHRDVWIAAALLTATVSLTAGAAPTTLKGAGATFPTPIYTMWFDDYRKAKPDVEIKYDSVGSGAGIKAISDHSADFGATDDPMDDAAMAALDGRILHIPTVLGAIVPVYNLQGVTGLKLSGPLLADLFLGKIKRWNASELAAENPGLKLPDAPVTVVRRSDGSGTTYCFTDYLTKVSPEWARGPGKGKDVKWPVGLGGKGNVGISNVMKSLPNSIGYVELIYAKQNSLPVAAIKNAAGKYIVATVESVTAAAAGTKIPKDYRVSITNASGEDAYPIATFTWLLVYEKNPAGKGPALREFLRWMLKEGQALAPPLGYAALPAAVKAAVAKTIESIQ